jgi:hypothetical protein
LRPASTTRAAAALLRIAREDGDAVVGVHVPDALELNVEFVSVHEVEQFAEQLTPGTIVVYGRFPAADEDGEHAVTLVLPDRDGVIRPHPY